MLLVVMVTGFLPAGAVEEAKPAVKVSIAGLEGELLQNTEALLSIRTPPPDDLPLDNWVRRHHARAPDQIRQALKPFGYYTPRITADLKQEQDRWLAHYQVDPGARVRLRKVDIQLSGAGSGDEHFARARDAIQLHPGDGLDHGRYEQAKALLQEVALRYGYLDAQFSTRELRVNAEQHWADVILHYDTGPRYHFGRVSFVQDVLNDELLQRFVPFEQGERYDRQKLVELENGLVDSNYFSNVEVELLKDEAVDLALPIRVTATPRKPQQYSLGLGYGTDTGPRLNLGFEWRRVNRLGHRAGANLTLSGIKQSLSAQYQLPIADVRKDTLTYGATALEEDAGDGISEERELGVTHTTDWLGWRRSLYFTAGQSLSRIDEERQRFDLFIPGITLTRTRSDNPIYPRQSYGLSLDVHGANQSLGSDVTFLQGRVLGRYIHPLGEKSRLLLRGEVGITSLDEATDLPLSERFFAGGDQSVRGYRYQALGDLDSDGNVVGGRYLLVTSVEVDRLIWNDWGVAVFLDAGNASDDSSMELFRGAGVGARWRSPIGLVRLDVATPLDDAPDGDDSNLRLHFGIGVEL